MFGPAADDGGSRSVSEKLVRGLRRQEQLRNRPQDNSDLQRKVPVLQVLKITRDSILNVGIISRFAAKTAHLSQPGNSRLNESADMVARHYFREFGVMFEQMRARADDAHLAAQHIPELRNFIDASGKIARVDKRDRRARSPGARSVRRPDASCEIYKW